MYKLIKLEIHKTILLKQTWIFVLILPLLVTIKFLWFTQYEIRHLNEYTNITGDKNPWNFFYMSTISQVKYIYSIILCVFVIFLGEIEHQAKMWKLIPTFPVKKISIFSAKIFILLSYNFFSLVLGLVSILVFVHFLSKIQIDYHFENFPSNEGIVVMMFIKYYITSFAMLIVHFVLSLRFKNLWMLGISLPIVSSVIAWDFLPHNLLDYTYSNGYLNLRIAVENIAGKVMSWRDMSIFELPEIISLGVFGVVCLFLVYESKKNILLK